MEIERITDGEKWWEIKTVLTRGMRRQIQKASLSSIPYDEAEKAGVNMENPDEVKRFLLRNPEYLSSTRIEDTTLLIATAAFCYGAVTQETLDSIPDADDEFVQKVYKRVNELWYAERKKHEDFFAPA